MTKRKENKEKKNKAIIEAALEVFAEKGYAVAKIAEIAQTAGVGKGTIYEYFRSKEDLFFAVFQWYVDEMVKGYMVAVSDHGGTPLDRLNMLFNSIFNSAYQHIDSFSIFFEFWAAAGNPAMRDRFRSAMLSMYDTFRRVITDLIKEGKASGIFREDTNELSIAAGLVGAMDGLMLQGWMDRTFDARTVSVDFFDSLTRGMISQKGSNL